ncbi:MAG: fatty acid desaturase [Bacteroidetes bacterium]|nr:fatty acid desaturase [Bacteroidota bacterium]
MQTIRFKVSIRDDHFYQTVRTRVHAYLKQQTYGRFGNKLMIVKGLLYLGFFWGLYACILSGRFSDVGVVGLYALMGMAGLLIAFNIAHDAVHEALTPWKGFNKTIYYLTFNFLGTDAYLWSIRHNKSHHLYPNVDDCDIDIDNNFLIRLSPNRPLLPHHRWQHLYAPVLYAFYTLHSTLYKDLMYLRRKNLANLRNLKHPWYEIFGFFAFKAVYYTYLIVLPYFVAGYSWTTVLLGFLALHVCMSYFFLFTNIMNHHAQEASFPSRDANGYLPGSWATHQMETCLDFYPTSNTWNFFFGGFNAHCAHHLFPRVCHVHYSAISKIILEAAAEFGVPHKEGTWWHGMQSHFRHLYDLGHIPPGKLISGD